MSTKKKRNNEKKNERQQFVLCGINHTAKYLENLQNNNKDMHRYVYAIPW